MIIINPNNLSSISSSLSGSYSGSMHGKMRSIVDENIISGSLSGSFRGSATGIFSTIDETNIQGTHQLIEGNGGDVGNVFHSIYSELGSNTKVQPEYEGAIRFKSLSDVSETYRGLQINGLNRPGVQVGQLISGWSFSDDFVNYGPGNGATNLIYTINNIHTDGLVHPFASTDPYNSHGTPGLLNTTISNKKLGSDLSALSASGAFNLVKISDTSIDSYNGSYESELRFEPHRITETLAFPNYTNTHKLLVVNSNNDILRTIGTLPVIGGQSFISKFDPASFFSSVQTINGINHFQIGRDNIIDNMTDENFKGPGTTFSMGGRSNITAVSQSQAELKYIVGTTDILSYDLVTNKLVAGANITGGDQINFPIGTSTVDAASCEFDHINAVWAGLNAPDNAPYNASNLDRLRGVPLSVTGEIDGAVYNGDFLAFGNGAGTSHTNGNGPNFGIAMPRAGKITAANLFVAASPVGTNYPVGIVYINGQRYDDQINATTFIFDTLANGAQNYTSFETPYARNGGIPFAAGDIVTIRMLSSNNQSDVWFPLVSAYREAQFDLWDNGSEDPNPDGYMSTISLTMFFQFD